MPEDREFIVGSDECGTGSAVGPLVVCALKAPKDWTFAGLKDSKQFNTRAKREKVRDELVKCKDFQYIIIERSNEEIDKLSMGVALKDAYHEAITTLKCENSFTIIDGTLKFPQFGADYMSLIKGDQKVQHIMAASILGKTYRDDKLSLLAKDYPEYGWHKNAGYLGKYHKDAIKKYGLTPLHRKSYNIKLT